MSAENLEVVRRFNAAVSAGPEEALAVISELWDADADYYPARKFPEARPCHGRQEFSQFLTMYLDVYSNAEWAIRELIAVGDDRVLACLNLRAEARESGIRLEGETLQAAGLAGKSGA